MADILICIRQIVADQDSPGVVAAGNQDSFVRQEGTESASDKQTQEHRSSLVSEFIRLL